LYILTKDTNKFAYYELNVINFPRPVAC